MQPVAFVLVFTGLWLRVVGLICVAMTIGAVLQFEQLVKEGFSPLALVPFAMFAFGYALLVIAYKSESEKSKAFLKELLKAEEVS